MVRCRLCGRWEAELTKGNVVILRYRFTMKGIGHFMTSGVLTTWWGSASNWRLAQPLRAMIVDSDGAVLVELDGLYDLP